MNARTVIGAAAAMAASAAIGLAAPASGWAASSSTPAASPAPSPSADALAQLKARCDNEVQRRRGTLGADRAFVQQSVALTDADRSALESQIDADVSGLTMLDTTIQGDTTYAQAHSDCERIVTDFRVYVLEDPKIHEVIAADGITKADASFQALIPMLQSDVNASSEPPNVKQEAQAALNDLSSKVASSASAIAGVAASVIGLTPQGYPGNAGTLAAAQQSIKTARHGLDGARADVTTVLHLLGQ